MGKSSHTCNCGYMVSIEARSKGIARRMCEHSQQQAVKLGFAVIGTTPKAYKHAKIGLVDSYIMYKWLRTS